MQRLVVLLSALAAATAAPAPGLFGAAPVGFAAPINPLAVRPVGVGYQQGYQPGYQQGYQPGYQQGYQQGYQPGYGGYQGGYNQGYGGYNNGYGGYPAGPAAPVGFAAPINPAVVAASQGPYSGYSHHSAIVARSAPHVDAVVTHAAPVHYAAPVAYAPSHGGFYH